MVSLVCGYLSFMASFLGVITPKYVEREVPIPFLCSFSRAFSVLIVAFQWSSVSVFWVVFSNLSVCKVVLSILVCL